MTRTERPTIHIANSHSGIFSTNGWLSCRMQCMVLCTFDQADTPAPRIKVEHIVQIQRHGIKYIMYTLTLVKTNVAYMSDQRDHPLEHTTSSYTCNTLISNRKEGKKKTYEFNPCTPPSTWAIAVLISNRNHPVRSPFLSLLTPFVPMSCKLRCKPACKYGTNALTLPLSCTSPLPPNCPCRDRP